jgi:hypothetical protein
MNILKRSRELSIVRVCLSLLLLVSVKMTPAQSSGSKVDGNYQRFKEKTYQLADSLLSGYFKHLEYRVYTLTVDRIDKTILLSVFEVDSARQYAHQYVSNIDDTYERSSCLIPHAIGHRLYQDLCQKKTEQFKIENNSLSDGGSDQIIVIDRDKEKIASFFADGRGIEEQPMTLLNDYRFLLEMNIALRRKNCSGMRKCYLRRKIRRLDKSIESGKHYH